MARGHVPASLSDALTDGCVSSTPRWAPIGIRQATGITPLGGTDSTQLAPSASLSIYMQGSQLDEAISDLVEQDG